MSYLLKVLFTSTLCLIVFSPSVAADNAAELATVKAKYERPASIPFPEENEYSDAKNELGKSLFFDPRLSASKTQSCATCHNPSLGWEDGMALGTGHGHKKLGRATPTVLNLAWDELFFWDGRAESLEEQALGPIASGGEMNMPLDDAIAVLKAISGYAPMFQAAFPEEKGEISEETIGMAIATYERTIISGEAPFDRWVKGDESAISKAAKKGFMLFNNKANCATCHTGWNFSDNSFHDIGLKSTDIGRFAHLKMPTMVNAFKTMGLRNIDQRAPYMHDGSSASLSDVVDHYNNGFVKRENLSVQIKSINLSQQEKQQLIAFLHTLTSVDEAVTFPVLPK
ncbi:MAG: c-type cytochrome [Mariprofundaceae bacterium]|nr:c-type cytochrome [Mariprofundaceae bacterium]